MTAQVINCILIVKEASSVVALFFVQGKIEDWWERS